jgi:hypothetical protein
MDVADVFFVGKWAAWLLAFSGPMTLLGFVYVRGMRKRSSV